MPLSFPFRNLVSVGAIGLLMAGCVPVEEYQAQRLKADTMAEQLAHAQSEIKEADARAETYKQQLAMAGNSGASSNALIANYVSQIADLQKQNDIWAQKYNDQMAKYGSLDMGNGPALNPTLDSDLKKFASQNPDLIDFDSNRGVVKFKSDVTFAVGDATVTPKVKEIIRRFAQILNESGADQYELLVAGHTDSTPVTNERTIKAGHFNNWFLSAHRAIAVGTELVADGVSSKRMGMVGYADKRPVASNASEAGKSANRRVEVLILPTSVHTSPSMAAAETKPTRHSKPAVVPAAVQAGATLNKDSGMTYTK